MAIIPEAIERLARQATRRIIFIAGPSATSDIEFSRVEEVHGLRTLHVLLIGARNGGAGESENDAMSLKCQAHGVAFPEMM